MPAEFLLYVPVDGVAYRTVVRWQRKNRVRVQFTGTEPKRRFHYGDIQPFASPYDQPATTFPAVHPAWERHNDGGDPSSDGTR